VTEEAESSFGEYIRRQRELHELTMRQLADMVGISNPYLSQIERGLRDPSERVLEAIAENLEMSAETLRRHKAPGAEETEAEPAVVAAIKADKALTAGQRKALIEVYESFVTSRA
jgi:transcriptional regulator with XRE-family HTH domain